MADENTGDWTAGIVAIVAALLFGLGVPAGLYYGLYKPRTKKYTDLQAKEAELKVRQEDQLIRKSVVNELHTDATKLETELNKVETRFTDASQIIVDLIIQAADDHNLVRVKKPGVDEEGAKIVKKGKEFVEWKEGLIAVEVKIEATGTYHDFGRFMAKVESFDKGVVIPKELIIFGDSSRGSEHRFFWIVYIVEKREVENVGR